MRSAPAFVVSSVLWSVVLSVAASTSAQAVRLQDAKYYQYDLRFTNPWCGPHKYDAPVKSINGSKVLTQKPLDVYCSGSEDNKRSGSRPHAVQQNIINWVNDPSTKEIFFAALSFSNSAFFRALCEAAGRGVKIEYVLDGPAAAGDLAACGPNVKFYQRGHGTGIGQGDGVNWAHNKLIIINPDSDPEKLKIAFGSGNFSSGMVTHHENWHFITAAKRTYFMQSHLCLREGLIGESARAKAMMQKFVKEKKFPGVLATHQSREGFGRFIEQCRRETGLQEESDIQAFFTPNRYQESNGQSAKATRRVIEGIQNSRQILLSAHRFSYSRMIDALERRLESSKKADIRLIADDDLFWVAAPASVGGGAVLGDNSASEAAKVRTLLSKGQGEFRVKYMETNHPSHQLNHSKYLVFDNALKDGRGAVFTGAGNLTGDAFNNNGPQGNFENFYYITIPDKVEQFRRQYGRLWGDIPVPQNAVPGVDFRGQATAPEDMPVGNPLPAAL